VAVGAVVVALTALLSLAAVLVSQSRSDSAVAATSDPASPAMAAAPASVVEAAAAPTSTVASDPMAQLQAVAAADSASVEGAVGSWMPQLSSKRPGLVADGQSWDAAAILAENATLRSAHPDARLLFTGEFANYTGRNFWATVVATPMPTAAAANAWCDAQGLDGDHCYAVRLMHSGGTGGNAVMRGGR
jgi:hypothetical protein